MYTKFVIQNENYKLNIILVVELSYKLRREVTTICIYQYKQKDLSRDRSFFISIENEKIKI